MMSNNKTARLKFDLLGLVDFRNDHTSNNTRFAIGINNSRIVISQSEVDITAMPSFSFSMFIS